MKEAAATRGDQSMDTESVIIQPELDPQATYPDEPDHREPKINLNQGEIFKALEIIERDSIAIAGMERGGAEDEDEKSDDEDLVEADEEEFDLDLAWKMLDVAIAATRIFRYLRSSGF
ncbi:hypothetical protein SADUNF_Sadunf11G0062700 [Salix dunnii]|uniref:Uncharacterized protein n=1 Tax=Salix dunnii TaxID=1413687 RepID=A0A835JKI2_9ROSI|nr:hypothetical protein SADUNF_Sadunf11G0062700 [Salix dunnii]